MYINYHAPAPLPPLLSTRSDSEDTGYNPDANYTYNYGAPSDGVHNDGFNWVQGNFWGTILVFGVALAVIYAVLVVVLGWKEKRAERKREQRLRDMTVEGWVCEKERKLGERILGSKRTVVKGEEIFWGGWWGL